MTILALATLGDATKNRNDPIYVASPKVAKAKVHTSVAVAGIITLNFPNGINFRKRFTFYLRRAHRKRQVSSVNF